MMKRSSISLPSYLRWFCSPMCLALMLAGCSSKKTGGFDGANAPFGAMTATTQVHSTATITSSMYAGSPIPLVTSVVGQKAIGGASYDRLVTASVNDPTKNIEYWVKHNADETLDFAGASTTSMASGIVPAASMTLLTPIKVNLNPAVGVAQAVTTSGTLTLPDTGASSTAAVTGQYTLLEKSVTVSTGMGPVAGCSHFGGNGMADAAGTPTVYDGENFAADVWYHPSFGVVAFNAPTLGIGTAMTDANDCGSVDSSGYKTIRKVGVVDASSSFNLGTYECDGKTFAADKNVEASMLLELRWVNENSAKTDLQPQPSVGFGTTMGYFPNAIAESPTSIFYPEENANGFKYWYSYVQQGDKNGYGDDSTDYHIKVGAVAGLSPVRVTARIYYKVLQSAVRGLDGSTTSTKSDPGGVGDTGATVRLDGGLGDRGTVEVDGGSTRSDAALTTPIDSGFSSLCTGVTVSFPFSEGSGASTMDLAKAHVGTLVGNVTWAAGEIGNGITTDGTSYVSVADAVDLDPGLSDFAVAAWVKIPASG